MCLGAGIKPRSIDPKPIRVGITGEGGGVGDGDGVSEARAVLAGVVAGCGSEGGSESDQKERRVSAEKVELDTGFCL